MATSSIPTTWQRPLLICSSFVLLVAALYVARAIIIPVLAAILLTLVLSPIVANFQRGGLGRIPSVILVVALAFCLVGGIGWAVVAQMTRLATELPQHKHEIIAKIDRIRDAGKEPWLDSIRDT